MRYMLARAWLYYAKSMPSLNNCEELSSILSSACQGFISLFLNDNGNANENDYHRKLLIYIGILES